MREIHQAKIGEYKCTCGFSGETALSVGTHKRYCGGVAPQDKVHKCEYCGFSSNTETGLKVHVSRAHPEKYNVALRIRISRRACYQTKSQENASAKCCL